jgi:acyl-coenzyme A thioesterase PaaI-like protein
MARESLQTRLTRHGFNLFPAFFGTGGRITFIADDWREVRVEIPLTVRTRNYVGTIYGGSMYGAVDPIYMIMLLKALGPDYVVWDREATIRFRRPGRQTLSARFVLGERELRAIRSGLRNKRSLDRVFKIELVDPSGEVCAEVTKTLYVARKDRAAKK